MSTLGVCVITDSTCDLPAAVCDRLGVIVVPIAVEIDGDQHADRVDLSSPDAIETLARASTAQPSIDAFVNVLRQAATDHASAVVITHSAKLGGTFESAQAAAAVLAPAFPVTVVDSGSVTMGLGFAVMRAAEMAQAGASAEEIAAEVGDQRGRTEVAFFVETLEYLERGGRIGRAAALIGGALQLKPMLRIDEGQIVPFDRSRTRARAIDDLAQFVADLGIIERVAVLHSSTPREAEEFAARLRRETVLPNDRVMVTRIGPAVVTHIGPGAMGVAVVDLPG